MRTISFLLIICVSAVAESNYIRGSSIENGLETECIPLSECSPYLWLLQHNYKTGLGFSQIFQFLMDRHCGFSGNDPKVRCPKEDVPITDEQNSIYGINTKGSSTTRQHQSIAVATKVSKLARSGSVIATPRILSR